MAIVTLGAANLRVSGDKRANLAHVLDVIGEAGSAGVDILVLPELCLQGYADFALGPGTPERAEQRRYFISESEPIPGPATQAVSLAAARFGMYVQLGMAEKVVDGNIIYNSAPLIGPRGVVSVYRKTHNQFEFPYFSPGSWIGSVELPSARVASLICYDLAFPEVMRIQALCGAEVALMSTAWPMKGHDRLSDYHGWAMDLAASANAFFNQMWLVVSNHCERGAYSTNTDYWGSSAIINPEGKVVARLGEDEGLLVYNADVSAELWRARTEAFFGLDLLQDRRADLYGFIPKSALELERLRIDESTGGEARSSEVFGTERSTQGKEAEVGEVLRQS